MHLDVMKICPQCGAVAALRPTENVETKTLMYRCKNCGFEEQSEGKPEPLWRHEFKHSAG